MSRQGVLPLSAKMPLPKKLNRADATIRVFKKNCPPSPPGSSMGDHVASISGRGVVKDRLTTTAPLMVGTLLIKVP